MRTTPENDELVADPATPTPPRRWVGAAVFGRLVIVLAVLGLAGGGIWLVTKASAPVASPTTMEIPALQVKAADVKPGTVVPVNATPAGGAAQQTLPQQAQPKPGKDPLAAWTERAAQATGIPARALLAYGNAELAMRQMQPNCKISWATLAGIGRIESNHGQYGGAVLGQDGRPSKPIIGVPLDGSPGVKAIGDTDGGQFDGDAAVDRAVGPMQFIPSTWRRYAADGNRDGAGDPQQIDDATLAAARYLCVNNRDMIAKSAVDNGWAGVVVNGVVRDSAELAELPLGVKALGTNSRKSAKAGAGAVDVPVGFGGVTFKPGDTLYSDEDGVVILPATTS